MAAALCGHPLTHMWQARLQRATGHSPTGYPAVDTHPTLPSPGRQAHVHHLCQGVKAEHLHAHSPSAAAASPALHRSGQQPGPGLHQAGPPSSRAPALHSAALPIASCSPTCWVPSPALHAAAGASAFSLANYSPDCTFVLNLTVSTSLCHTNKLRGDGHRYNEINGLHTAHGSMMKEMQGCTETQTMVYNRQGTY